MTQTYLLNHKFWRYLLTGFTRIKRLHHDDLGKCTLDVYIYRTHYETNMLTHKCKVFIRDYPI